MSASFAERARLWQAAQVAERLALTPAAFCQRRRRLEEDHGFPAPVPGVGRRWNPAAVEAWLARQTGQFPDARADLPETILIARARSLAEAPLRARHQHKFNPGPPPQQYSERRPQNSVFDQARLLQDFPREHTRGDAVRN